MRARAASDGASIVSRGERHLTVMAAAAAAAVERRDGRTDVMITQTRDTKTELEGEKKGIGGDIRPCALLEREIMFLLI